MSVHARTADDLPSDRRRGKPKSSVSVGLDPRNLDASVTWADLEFIRSNWSDIVVRSSRPRRCKRSRPGGRPASSFPIMGRSSTVESSVRALPRIVVPWETADPAHGLRQCARVDVAKRWRSSERLLAGKRLGICIGGGGKEAVRACSPRSGWLSAIYWQVPHVRDAGPIS